MHRLLPFALLLLPAASARADDFCPERPGQTTPPCTLPAGRTLVEGSLYDRASDGTTQSTALAGLTVRHGLGSRWEAQILLPSAIRAISADGRVAGLGDTGLAVKRSLGDAALKLVMMLPTGRAGIGAGDWGAALLVPAQVTFGRVTVGLTPELDAAVDGDGRGRHLAFGTAAGLSLPLTGRLTLGGDIRWLRDEDPAGATTRTTAAAELAWTFRRNLQLDVQLSEGVDLRFHDVTIGFAVGF